MALPFPDIDPVAFSVGPFDIRWYALAYMAGFLLGWQYCLRLAGRYGESVRPNKVDVDDFLPWAVLGVILGGRLGYVLFYQSGVYLEQPLEIFKIWHGGMSFHGGMCGVIAAIVAYSLVRKISMLRFGDLLACVAPIGLFFGRLANFVNGELYGRVADVPWAVEFPRGGGLPRHPSQLYEALLEGLVLFIVLFVLARMERVRNRDGLLAGVFLLGYGVFRSFAELFREPDEYLGFFLGAITMGQVLSLPMILAGLGLVAYALKSGGANGVSKAA